LEAATAAHMARTGKINAFKAELCCNGIFLSWVMEPAKRPDKPAFSKLNLVAAGIKQQLQPAS
jgi:hypothetical protein